MDDDDDKIQTFIDCVHLRYSTNVELKTDSDFYKLQFINKKNHIKLRLCWHGEYKRNVNYQASFNVYNKMVTVRALSEKQFKDVNDCGIIDIIQTTCPEKLSFNKYISELVIWLQRNKQVRVSAICNAFQLLPNAKVHIRIFGKPKFDTLCELVICAPRDFDFDDKSDMEFSNYSRVLLKQIAFVMHYLDRYPDLVKQIVHLFTK